MGAESVAEGSVGWWCVKEPSVGMSADAAGKSACATNVIGKVSGLGGIGQALGARAGDS
jgi:hypothetical protein